MMTAATAGGYAGAPLARALPRGVVRAVVIFVGAAMTAFSSDGSSCKRGARHSRPRRDLHRGPRAFPNRPVDEGGGMKEAALSGRMDC